jgi:hypothetical protein
VTKIDTDVGQMFTDFLRRAKPDAQVDDLGFSAFEDCLVEGVEPDTVRGIFATADGRPGGRQPRLYGANSSLMLAVNVFAPWQAELGGLSVLDHAGFADMRFELRLPDIGETSEWLDVLLVAPGGLVGVVSDCTGYLSGHTVEFSEARERFWEGRPENEWRREMLAVGAGTSTYARLDASRLISQYMGLSLLVEAAGGGTGRNIPAVLLYLYWEPLNAARFDEFDEHRAETRAFAKAVEGSRIGFAAMSYIDLWAAWARGKAPDWLAMHLARLHQHYSFRI